MQYLTSLLKVLANSKWFGQNAGGVCRFFSSDLSNYDITPHMTAETAPFVDNKFSNKDAIV